MGMPSLLRKVFLVDLLQGLKVTFRYQDPKEIYTEQYPMERPQVAERYRGAPRLNVNPDTDETMCIACDLCALACPENLIVVSSARNEQTRRKELTNFHLRPEPLHVLRPLRGRLSRGRARTHAGFRTRQLYARRLDLGPRDARKRSAAHAVLQASATFMSSRRTARCGGPSTMMSCICSVKLARERRYYRRFRRPHYAGTELLKAAVDSG
jgi:ferredoxin